MNRGLGYLGIAMSAFFVFMGVLIPMEPPSLLSGMSSTQLYLIGFVLIVYGIFRFYRSYKAIRQK